MPVTSVIVEVEEGTGEAVLNSLSKIDNVSVYGIKDNQIVTVIEGNELEELEDTIRILYSLNNVIGVFPVFSGDL